MVVGDAAAAGGFFFFQAEDGIRDRNVTGVQTCALPIYRETDTLAADSGAAALRRPRAREFGALDGYVPALDDPDALALGEGAAGAHARRSEERRVGKGGEWRRGTKQMKAIGRVLRCDGE